MTKPVAAGKRYILASGRISFEEVARLAVKAVPELASRIVSAAGAPFAESFLFDGSDAERDLGIKCGLNCTSMYRAARLTSSPSLADATLEECTAKFAKQVAALPEA